MYPLIVVSTAVVPASDKNAMNLDSSIVNPGDGGAETVAIAREEAIALICAVVKAMRGVVCMAAIELIAAEIAAAVVPRLLEDAMGPWHPEQLVA